MSKITVEQIGELVQQSKGESSRVTRENLQAFLRNPNASLHASVYPVAVDYGKTVEEMVSVGHYDWKNNDINSKNFPARGKGKISVNTEFVHLGEMVDSENELSHFEKNGMRPATVEELLAFGATYPEIQREFPIICLGSSWIGPGGGRYVPFLLERGSERVLDLRLFVRGWGRDYRFLVVRK
jgi:hypothetical protein